MKKLISKIALGVMALAGCAYGANAQNAQQQPMIELHTTLPEQGGGFHFVIGSTEDTYIDMDCGLGSVEVEVSQAVFDPDTQSIQGTVVSGQVSNDGIIRIYGDPKIIDYLDLEGLYITEAIWPELTELQILNLTHNQFKGLDLSHMTKLEALYIDDNPFTETPLVIGSDKPNLTILSMSIVGNLSPSFNVSDYPELRSLVAFSTPTLTKLDPSGCPKLMQLSIDVTNVETLDVSKNPALLILNVSDSRITSLDLSKNANLSELYITHDGYLNRDYKFTDIDLSNNPRITRFYCSGNHLTNLDLSPLKNLVSFGCANNLLTGINFDSNPSLYEVNISQNYMDYTTIPAERNTFHTYYYEQRPFAVNTQYEVGATIDFSAKVNRPESTTDAVLYAFNEEQPSDPILLEDKYYKWENGKITLLEAYPDSVYVAFKNTALPNAILTSSRFRVKTAEDFGKPTATASARFAPTVREYALSVGLAGASLETPRKFSVDFGDGKLVEFSATSNTLPLEANVKATKPTGGSGTVTVYLPDGEQLTALGINGQRLLSTDLKAAHALSELSITGCNLGSIDLTWNKCLYRLDLSDNRLSEINLTGVNAAYGKGALQHINFSGNQLSAFEMEDPRALLTADFSNNNFTTIPLGKMAGLKSLNLSGNSLLEVDLRDLEAIEELNLSNNCLSTIGLPDYLPLTSLDIRGNNFTFASLPSAGVVAEYFYAPQKEISLPEKAPVVSLFDYLFEADGANTVYNWYMAADNSPVAEGNIRENNGRFFFTNPDLGQVYCTLTNAAFPDFNGENILRTTSVQTAPMPTHVFATFTPVANGTGSLSLAANTKGAAVYIDWTGEGDMEQYILDTQYKQFSDRVLAGKQGKCYTYDENDGVSVFSISGMALSQLDASPMKGLKAFMSYGAGLTDEQLKLPVNSPLKELTIADSRLSSTNFLSSFPDIEFLTLSGNKIENPDVSSLKKLQGLNFSSAELTQIKLDNPELWDLHIENNKFETIDLSGVPNVMQVFLNSNNLTSIDVSKLNSLRVLNLDGNRLTFATLPVANPNWYIYSYLGQQIIDIEVVDNKVDLSAQREVNGTATEYRWFIDSPYLDENNELAGEELVEGIEYSLENGVTTFLTNQEHIMCVMTNANFPSLFLLTSFINVTTVGIDNVNVEDGDAPVEYFNLQGIRVAEPKAGIYIRRQGNNATKVYIR